MGVCQRCGGRLRLHLEALRSRQREVSRELWTFNWWHGMTALSGIGVMGVTGLATDAYADYLARRRKDQRVGERH